jgi:hypothetical protein
MLYLKVIFYLTLIIGVIALYIFCLYKTVTVPISNEMLKLHVDGLINEKIAIELELEKVTVKLKEQTVERDEIQAVIANLTETANDQGFALIILGVFTVGCVALIAFIYFKSSSGSDAPASSGSVVDVAQSGFTNLLNSHIEATKMITILEAKSQQMNSSIFALTESVSSLKAQIAGLSVSINAGQGKIQLLINLIEMSQK